MNKEKCGAKTRGGSPCKRSPAKGSKSGRCKLHGGASPSGLDSPHWKSGIYSRYASESLADVLDELNKLDPEDLMKVDEEIRLLKGLIISSNALKQDVSELRDLDTLSKVIDRLIYSVQRSVALQIEQKRLVPVSDVSRFIDFCEQLLIDRVGEADGYAIIEEFKNFKLSQN